MARFRSGKESSLFDSKTNLQTKEDLKKLTKDLAGLKSSVYNTSDIDKMLADRDKIIQDHTEIIRIQRHQILGHTQDIMMVHSILMVFLNSKFVRFLNFFGCWYIYGKHGCIYLNLECNEKFGKAPFLTRLKRWFRNTFNKNGFKFQQVSTSCNDDHSEPDIEETENSDLKDD